MSHILMFALSTVGMTFIIVDGSIMKWFRELVQAAAAKVGLPSLGGVVDCYLCCGTWCGFLMGVVWVSYNPWYFIPCGFAGGFLANFAATLFNYLEANSIVDKAGQ